MRRVVSIEDEARGIVRYELSGGAMCVFPKEMVAEYGIAELLRRTGFGDLVPTARLPVMHDGVRVGTMAADFDPDRVRSRSMMYDPRPGDFRRERDTWVAARSLGGGDLDAVVGFRRE